MHHSIEHLGGSAWLIWKRHSVETFFLCKIYFFNENSTMLCVCLCICVDFLMCIFGPWKQMLEVGNTWSWSTESICTSPKTSLLKWRTVSVIAGKYYLCSWFKHTLKTALLRFVLQNSFYRFDFFNVCLEIFFF